MFSKLRSLIFKIDPEIAHTLAIKSLKLNLVSNIFNKDMGDSMFESTLFGKTIDNPIVNLRCDSKFLREHISWRPTIDFETGIRQIIEAEKIRLDL